MNKIWFFAILIFCGCSVKKPDICEKEKIECLGDCNKSVCVLKCERRYKECVSNETVNGIGSYLYDTIYLNNDKGEK
jgi:hypothetical protein